jgi:hypothetical protein
MTRRFKPYFRLDFSILMNERRLSEYRLWATAPIQISLGAKTEIQVPRGPQHRFRVHIHMGPRQRFRCHVGTVKIQISHGSKAEIQVPRGPQHIFRIHRGPRQRFTCHVGHSTDSEFTWGHDRDTGATWATAQIQSSHGAKERFGCHVGNSTDSEFTGGPRQRFTCHVGHSTDSEFTGGQGRDSGATWATAQIQSSQGAKERFRCQWATCRYRFLVGHGTVQIPRDHSTDSDSTLDTAQI